MLGWGFVGGEWGGRMEGDLSGCCGDVVSLKTSELAIYLPMFFTKHSPLLPPPMFFPVVRAENKSVPRTKREADNTPHGG